MLWLGTAEFWGELQGAVILENFPRTSYELKIKNIINFNFKRSTAWGGDINVLIEDISYITEQKGTVVFLAGEIRAVNNINSRVSEAERLGFKRCVIPYYSVKNMTHKSYGIEIIGVKNIREAFDACSNS